MTLFNRETARVDGPRKVTGAAPYAAEVQHADMAHAVLVASTVACGSITRIDRQVAEQAPGVLAVITHENGPRLGQPSGAIEHAEYPGESLVASGTGHPV